MHRLGTAALQLGNPTLALAYFNKAIELQPRSAEYHNGRGNSLRALGRLPEAAASYCDCLRLRGDFLDALCNLGMVLLMTGRFVEAETCGRKAVGLSPDAWDAQTLMGHALGCLGRYAEAEACHRAAVSLNRNVPEGHNNLGHALSQLGRATEAERCYREALRLKDNFADAHNNLGCCLKDLGRPAEAESYFRRALQLRLNYVEAYINLADTLYLLGRPAEAETCAKEAVRLRPTSAEAHNSLGCARRNLRKSDEAAASFRRALQLRAGFPEAYNNLGSTLVKLGRLNEAETCFQAALRLRPTFPDVEINMGGLRLAQGRFDSVVPQYEKALSQVPDSALAWRGLLVALPYLPDLSAQKSFQLHCAFGEAAAREAKPQPLANDRDPARKLRIGWLSSDLSDHPVGRNLELIFAHRDRAAFETFCYADVRTPTPLTEWFRSQSDGWRSISGLPDAAVADLIRKDQIDVMVYLAGRFDHNRPQVAAWRPAPIQISLHDPATSGLREMDYLIADPILAPRNGAESFTERVLRLPNFCLHAPLTASPDPAPSPSSSGDGVTFACFHNHLKLNASVLAVWRAILQRIPNSRLLFKYLDLFASEEMRDKIRQRIGMEFSNRIDFRSTRTSVREHLATYNEVDIALDPFPFNGSTATFESLWMAVPVITLAGDRMVSRWSASMLRKVGLCDVIAATPNEYVDIAARLAADKRRLIALRHTLRDRVRRSSLCDGQRTTRYLERTFRAAWRKWCRAPQAVQA